MTILNDICIPECKPGFYQLVPNIVVVLEVSCNLKFEMCEIKKIGIYYLVIVQYNTYTYSTALNIIKVMNTLLH